MFTPHLILMIPPPPRPTLFPYTTLFRSQAGQPVCCKSVPGKISECLDKLVLELSDKAFGIYTKQPAVYLSGNNERSEEHTSELQSQSNLVCRLLLEKKKKTDGSSIAVCM